MADVLICLEQIETRLKKFPNEFDEQHRPTKMAWDKVMEIKEKKLERLKERLFDSLDKKYPNLSDPIMGYSRWSNARTIVSTVIANRSVESGGEYVRWKNARNGAR